MDGAKALFDTLLDATGDAVMIADTHWAVHGCNPAFFRATGYGRAELDAPGGEAMANLFSPALREGLTKAESTNETWMGPVSMACQDGVVRVFDVAIRPACDSNGARRFVTFWHDRAGDEVGLDALTGLPNKFLFTDRVVQSLLNARRVDKSVSLLIMGLDRFSRVNDAFGHDVGDTVLREVAQRLQKVIRSSDTGARLEGDKFAVVTPIASQDDSVIVAEKVLKAMHEPFVFKGQDVVITFSIGISVFPTDGDTAGDLVKHADSALHHAKAEGRNRYQFYANEMNSRAKHRLALEQAMRRALANDEFVVYYQPKMDIERDIIIGMEALIRWQDPDRGMISPAEFIPVAEETGLIEEIGYWVLKRACLDNQGWQAKGLSPVRVSVNVSAHQFRSRHMVQNVVDVLDQTGLDPSWLELEITESMLMGNVDDAVAKMRELRDLGLHLSIDDFGTGYSSLSYLGRFPITTLKIDRAFIHDVETNAFTAEIARAIIGLSRGLSLEVVAEGAELAEQVQFLRDHGCDVVQGFFYSRPMPAEQFEDMLVKQAERLAVRVASV